jgi:mannitol/fructose-specific phosphotransferase system IIA component (Ntr-type)
MSLNFSDVLRPAQIVLNLEADTQENAVLSLMDLLRGDDRVADFASLEKAVVQRNAPALCDNGIGLCIAHGRTNSLSSLVMAAARLANPLPLTGDLCGKGELHLIFVAGIPSCLNCDYLRLVGAIARICSQAEGREALLVAPTAEAFLEVLQDGLNPL